MKKGISAALLLLLSITIIAQLAPTLLAQAPSGIVVDGDSSDWALPTPDQENTGVFDPDLKEFVWRDAANDDYGATDFGSYTYPDNAEYYTYPGQGGAPGGEADLVEFRFKYNQTHLMFLFKLNSLKSEYAVAVEVSIDTDGVNASGFDWQAQTNEVVFAEQYYPDIHVIVIHNTLIIMKRTSGWVDISDSTCKLAISTERKTIEVAFPISKVEDVNGNPVGKTWRFFVTAGCGAPFNDEWSDQTPDFVEVASAADENHPGGGTDDWPDPDVFDIMYNGTTEEQVSLFSANEVLFLGQDSKSYVELTFPKPPLNVELVKIQVGTTTVENDSAIEPNNDVMVVVRVLFEENESVAEQANVKMRVYEHGEYLKRIVEMVYDSVERTYSGTIPSDVFSPGEYYIIEISAEKGGHLGSLTLRLEVKGAPMPYETALLAVLGIVVVAVVVFVIYKARASKVK